MRNPMYLGVGSVIAGEALVLDSGGLLWWLLVFAVSVVTFVKVYEEPTLRERYGESYARYQRGVPGWLPRPTPWRPT